MDIISLLKIMVDRGASDLHIKVGNPPTFRIKRDLIKLDDMAFVTPKDSVEYANFLMSEHEKIKFEKDKEVDFAYTKEKLGRFRANIFRQKNNVGIVVRYVKSEIPSFAELNLPPVMEKISLFERGLVLITGSSSSGKSTTLASIVNYINMHRRCHIVTIEDPIEYMHEDNLAIINQREVGLDTESFKVALKHVVRQDPDIICVGELRDADTFQTAVSAAETGHLVFATLHSQDVSQAITRVLDYFPSSEHEQVRNAISSNLRAVTSQRFTVRKDGLGVVPAMEVMIINETIAKLIREARFSKFINIIQSSRDSGMQTFNQALADLVKKDVITLEEALAKSGNPDALKMNMKGIYLDDDRSIIGD